MLGVLFWDVTLCCWMCCSGMWHCVIGCVVLNSKDYNFLELFDPEDEGIVATMLGTTHLMPQCHIPELQKKVTTTHLMPQCHIPELHKKVTTTQLMTQCHIPELNKRSDNYTPNAKVSHPRTTQKVTTTQLMTECHIPELHKKVTNTQLMTQCHIPELHKKWQIHN